MDRHRNHFDNYFTGPIAGLDRPTVTSTERCYSADVITSSKRNAFIFSDPGRYWFLTHCGFSSLRLYSVGTFLSVDRVTRFGPVSTPTLRSVSLYRSNNLSHYCPWIE